MAKKIIFPLLVIAIFVSFFAFLTISKENQNLADSKLADATDPSQIAVSGSPEVLSATTTKDMNSWLKYKDPEFGFSVLYPPEFKINKDSSNLLISKIDSTGKYGTVIKFTSRALMDNETVNTIAEKDINEILDKDPLGFALSETITPISIDRTTAITYKLLENKNTSTYFYVPTKGNQFVEVSIIGENSLSPEDISIIDRVVYSLELQ